MAVDATYDSGAPVRRPVRLDRVDTDGKRQTWTLIQASVALASQITGYGDGDRAAIIANEIAARMITGSARHGLELQDLCRGRLGEGHVREGFTGELMATVDIAVRLIQAFGSRPVIHEQIFSAPTRTGRESEAIGSDQIAGAARVAHMIAVALGAADRHVPNLAIPFTYGTRDDHTSCRADAARIAAFSADLGRQLPGLPHEHFQALLKAQQRARKLVERAIEETPELFVTAGLEPTGLLRRYFPWCVVVNALPYGPPSRRGATSGDWVFPGDDESIVQTLLDAHKYGVVRCGVDLPLVSVDERDDAIDVIAADLGESPVDITPGDLDKIKRTQPAVDLGIPFGWAIRYWWFPENARLVRGVEVVDPESRAEFVELEQWRAIRLGDRLPAAVVLIERAQEAWTARCLERYLSSCEPGKMKPYSTKARSALLLHSFIGNAAAVAAERAMQSRRL
jgi:hypothetical protein